VTCIDHLKIELKVLKFQRGLTIKEFLESLLNTVMDRSSDKVFSPFDKIKMMSDGALNRLP
jgi:hypothetical protein